MTITRIPYPRHMFRVMDEDVVRDVRQWVASRLRGHGLGMVADPWKITGGRSLSVADAHALHATLVDVVGRATSLRLPESTIREHSERWVLEMEAAGITRVLTKSPAPLDGRVFTQWFEWPGHIPGGSVQFYFWYAPIATLRGVDSWLHEVTSSAGVDLHERAFFLRALGRLDPVAAVATARELLIQSPWATSEVLGMYGGAEELDMMRSALLEVAKREEARTRRHFEAGMRKLERRLGRALAG
jgi:hypothetical protein